MPPKSSRRKGSAFPHEGYLYWERKSTTTTTRYFRCIEGPSQCPATLNIRDGVATVNSIHLHDTNAEKQELENFRDALWTAVISKENEDFRTIYDDLSTDMQWRYVAPQVPFAKVSKSMQRWRAELRPRIPETLAEYGDRLKEEVWKKYREYPGGCLISETEVVNDKITVTIIGDPNFIASMENVEVLHIDATFDVCPKKPYVYQVLTIMGRVGETAIPMAWALMTSKKFAAYKKVFQLFKARLAPNLNPQSVHADFEAALKKSIKEIYPGITVVHCYFHYCQAILRKLKNLKKKKGMKKLSQWEAGKVFFRKLLALALLPAEDIPPAYGWLINNTPQDVRVFFKDLITYYQKWWLQRTGPTQFTVFRVLRRTNNSIEAYHRVLHKRLGTHPGIWPFTAKLKNLQTTSAIELDTIRIGLPVRRPVEKKYTIRNELLFHLWDLYNKNSISLPRFLSCASHISGAFHDGLLIETVEQLNQFIDGQVHNITVPPRKTLEILIVSENSEKRTPIPILRHDPGGANVDILIVEDIQQSLCTFCGEGLLNVQAYPCEEWFACENCTERFVREVFKRDAQLCCPLCLEACVAFKVLRVT